VIAALAALVLVADGPAEVMGQGLDREAIEAGVRQHRTEVQACASATDAGAVAGTLKVQFIISAMGTVAQAKATSVDSGLPESVVDCVLQAIHRCSFPMPHGGGVILVTYPFSLKPKK
jgi:hypothetical protein